MARRCMAAWPATDGNYSMRCQNEAKETAGLRLTHTSVLVHYCRECWEIEFGWEPHNAEASR